MRAKWKFWAGHRHFIYFQFSKIRCSDLEISLLVLPFVLLTKNLYKTYVRFFDFEKAQ